MKYKIEKMIDYIQSHLGEKISDGTPSQVIDDYNKIKPLPRGYKMPYNAAACAATVSAAAFIAGIKDFCFECGCGEMVKNFNNKGCKIHKDISRIEPGNLIFYDWTIDGILQYNHVGIIYDKNGSQIKVLEGNNGKKIAIRTIVDIKNYSYLAGIIDFSSLVQDDIITVDNLYSTLQHDINSISENYWKEAIKRGNVNIDVVLSLVQKYHNKMGG